MAMKKYMFALDTEKIREKCLSYQKLSLMLSLINFESARMFRTVNLMKMIEI